MQRAGVEVESGAEYDHLFPKAEGNTIVVKASNATVEDTLRLMREKIPLTLGDTKKIAKLLKGETLEETCSNIWHFVFRHIKYKKDEDGKEQVRRPARTWANRHSGVDCDCMTEFISSILTNLDIPHKGRIAKYNRQRGWQHIYPIVPINGSLDEELSNRNDYIVIDCVKYNYNEEEPYLEFKDYTMKLEYLNGTEDEEETLYEVPESADIQDLAAASEEEEAELGKLGKWLKKAVKNVGSATKKVVRAANRYTNPGTILLRNGFLLIMKENLFGVASKLRYAYLTDAQALSKGMNLDALNKVRKIKDKAESIFFQAGGKKENLKAAILKGRGNKDKSVPMSGLEGYEDEDMNGDLGVLPAAAIAAATSAVTAIAGALKQVKGLFNKPTPEAKAFDNHAEVQVQENTSESESAALPETDNAAPSAISTLINNSTERTGPQLFPMRKTGTETATQSNPPSEGFLSQTLAWAKQHPIPTLLIVAAVGGGTYLLLRGKKEGQKTLNGPPVRKKYKLETGGKIKAIKI